MSRTAPARATTNRLLAASIPQWFVSKAWDAGLTTSQIIQLWQGVEDRLIETPLGYVAIPSRKLGENLLSWLARCQGWVLDKAVEVAAQRDPNLRIRRMPGGWNILMIDTGLRIDVQTATTMERRDANGAADAERGGAG